MLRGTRQTNIVWPAKSFVFFFALTGDCSHDLFCMMSWFDTTTKKCSAWHRPLISSPKMSPRLNTHTYPTACFQPPYSTMDCSHDIDTTTKARQKKNYVGYKLVLRSQQVKKESPGDSWVAWRSEGMVRLWKSSQAELEASSEQLSSSKNKNSMSKNLTLSTQ